MNELCERWNLTDPVLIATTFACEVYRVRQGGKFAVLKILNERGRQFESQAPLVLSCFAGHGAVLLLASDARAQLIEFIDGPDLKSVVVNGEDSRACEILCDVLGQLHAYAGPRPEGLISMERNFQVLFAKVPQEPVDSVYRRGAQLARSLIATARDEKVLHGDLHHENVLQSSARGWLAIDPQCLFGERTYDLANAFYNPRGQAPLTESVTAIQNRTQIFARRMNLDPKRILEFAFAYGCLSAAWSLHDQQDPEPNLRVAKIIETLIEG